MAVVGQNRNHDTMVFLMRLFPGMKQWYVLRLKNRNPRVRLNAARKLVKDRNIHIHEYRTAVEVLGQLGNSKDIGVLCEMVLMDFSDDNYHFLYYNARVEAARARGSIGGTTAVEALSKRISDEWITRQGYKRRGTDDDVHGFLREAIAEALGKLGDKRAIKPLKQRLSDSEQRVRAAVERALKNIMKVKGDVGSKTTYGSVNMSDMVQHKMFLFA